MTLLESGLQQISGGPAAIDAWLHQHPDALTPAFTAELSRQAKAALQGGSPDTAMAAYILATFIHQRRGDGKGMLTSRLHQIEIMFMLAQTTEAYERAHEQARQIGTRAAKEGSVDLAFWAFGLAADSGFWGSDVAPDAATRRQWLRLAMDTLLEIEALSPSPAAAGAWQRFVSSLVATYQTTMDQTWGADEPVVEASLRRLAALAERLIPTGFTFEDPQKTAHVARYLADLSSRFGSRKAADERLRRAQQTKRDIWSE
jgi:hypothetical protein